MFVIWSCFCDLVHVQSVIELLGKQVNNALNMHWITKRRQNHKNLSFARLTPELLSKNARLSPAFLQKWPRLKNWIHCFPFAFSFAAEKYLTKRIRMKLILRIAKVHQDMTRRKIPAVVNHVTVNHAPKRVQSEKIDKLQRVSWLKHHLAVWPQQD